MSAQRESDEASGSNQAGSSNSGDAVEEVCAFCLDTIPDKDACFSTACTHISHKVCLLRWLENNRTCATCRTPVEVVKMKSGKNVTLPPLLPLPPEFVDPLTDEQMAAGVGLTTDEEDSHSSSSSSEDTEEDEAFDAVSYTRNQSRVRPSQTSRVPRTRRSTRQSGQPLALSLEEEQREAGLALMVGFISRSVGSTRSQRGGLSVRGGAPVRRRRRPRGVDFILDDVELDESDEEVQAREESETRMSSTPPRPRGADFILDDVELDESDEEVQAREEMRSFRTEEEEEGSDSSGSETDSGSDESSGDDSEEETGSEDSELDESVLDDQPSTSRQMIPIVRKKRGAKKKTTKRKRTTTKKKKTEGGTVKRKTKRRKTTKRGTKRGTKRRRPNAEERTEQRQRVRAAFPSLSLNGAAMDPLSADEADEPPAPKRARIPAPPPSVAVAADPTDLLGSIFTSQVIAHAHGRHLKQEDGKLVPRDSFNRHLDRLERRGILPVDRAEVAPSSSSSLPSSSRPVPVQRATGIATMRTGASANSSSSPVAVRPNNPISRNTNASRPSDRPFITSSDPTPRAVPLVSPFDRSTPLPRIYRPTPPTPLPPPPTGRSNALPPPPPSHARLPSGHSRDSTFRDVKLSEDDKKEVARIMKERMQSERSHQIREAVNSILASERRERRITDDEYRMLTKRIMEKFFNKLLFERETVVEWTRSELGNLLEEKMFAPITLD